MSRFLVSLALILVSTLPLYAEETANLQVAPSDQIRYPDASQILNPVTPQATPAPVAKVAVRPLVASQPVRAAASPSVSVPSGWYLLWHLAGSEAAATAFRDGLTALPAGLERRLQAVGNDSWELWVGPLTAETWSAATTGQAGQAVLVHP